MQQPPEHVRDLLWAILILVIIQTAILAGGALVVFVFLQGLAAGMGAPH